LGGGDDFIDAIGENLGSQGAKKPLGNTHQLVEGEGKELKNGFTAESSYLLIWTYTLGVIGFVVVACTA